MQKVFSLTRGEGDARPTAHVKLRQARAQDGRAPLPARDPNQDLSSRLREIRQDWDVEWLPLPKAKKARALILQWYTSPYLLYSQS